MKVLHVVSYFPPNRLGGVGEVVSHLHKGLLKEGHESEVLTTGTLHDDPRILRIASTPFKFVIILFKYAKKARDFDLVHCQQGETVIFPLMMKILRISTPVLVTFHGGYRGLMKSYHSYKIDGRKFNIGWKGLKYRIFIGRFHQIVNWLILKLVDNSSFISKSSALDILGTKNAENAIIIYNGIPTENFDVKVQSPDPADILYVGNCNHWKRVFILPFILRYIRHSIPDVKLRIIGFDIYTYRNLKKLFEEFGLMDAVTSEGELPSSFEIRPFYKVSKVLVVPSIYEGLPMVILEAMQNGLPCVATKVSGHPEIIQDGVNGFLVEKDNPRQMANKCIDILSNDRMQKKMGEAASRLINKHFKNTHMISNYLNLYGEMINK